jgi:2-polyprenyl-6-methoxyphenol hydroxylase-like FAD-dependent oxidoreductase
MMLGYLLARAGVDVVVLEKHADFLRDFRGDTIHPSTLEVMHELGLLDEFLARPHQEVRQLTGRIAGQPVTVADLSHLPTRCKFVAFMPQWDFLDFLAEHGRRLPAFRLDMRTEATGLLEENGRVAGVTAMSPGGPIEVRAHLTVAADGRSSALRARAGLVVEDLGAPIDVLWMRLSRRADDPRQVAGYFDAGHVFVMLDRGEYWQCAFVIPKGGFDEMRQGDIEPLRRTIAAIEPRLADRVGELRTWDDVKLLTVRVDRLRRWYRPGLLCIGDAAHAMSPVGGVGINLAIQDAVAAANLLARCLARQTCSVDDLRRVQARREFPTRVTQRVQVVIQKRIIAAALEGRAFRRVPWPARLLQKWPMLRRLPARFIGLGVRPEHVALPDTWRDPA